MSARTLKQSLPRQFSFLSWTHKCRNYCLGVSSFTVMSTHTFWSSDVDAGRWIIVHKRTIVFTAVLVMSQYRTEQVWAAVIGPFYCTLSDHHASKNKNWIVCKPDATWGVVKKVKFDISDMRCGQVTEWHTCLPWIFSMPAAADICNAIFRLLHFQVRASSGYCVFRLELLQVIAFLG
jgi:hypothetical protein